MTPFDLNPGTHVSFASRRSNRAGDGSRYAPQDVIRAGGWARFIRTAGTMLLGLAALYLVMMVTPA